MTETNVSPEAAGGGMEEAIRAELVNGKLPCAEAFKIAKQHKVAPRQVGDTANRLTIKIMNCQLGCFP